MFFFLDLQCVQVTVMLHFFMTSITFLHIPEIAIK